MPPFSARSTLQNAWLGVLVMFCAAAVAPPSYANIRINEILANPIGTDTGTERIEIYNAGPNPIDVTGWAIDDAATFDDISVRARLPEDFDTSTCSGSAIIQPGEYRLVKGQSTNAWVNNAGDDIYLISDRTSVPPPVVHQVTYGQSQEGMGYAAVPDGSDNFAWQALSLCATNGGAGDVTPPSTVNDLQAVPGDLPGETKLIWTAPGDDNMTGTASEYRIKVSYAAINGGNFESAADLERWTNEPLPAIAGSTEEWTIFGMDPDSIYFFALIAVDDASNPSGVSNSPSTAAEPGSRLDPDLGFNTYFGNLHSHTTYSDGELTPADAYNYARFTAPTPLDFLAVSDHNHSAAGMSLPNYGNGLSQATAANDDGNFVAIYGQEWGLAANGHVIVLETEDLFGWEIGNYDVFVAEGDYTGLYDAILANPPDNYPIVASFCHPGSNNFNNFQVTSNGLNVMKLIALVNGPAGSTATDESDVGNTNFDGVFAEALRLGWRVSPVADQDNHHATWGASSESRTAVLAAENSKSAILNALAARRTYATMDHNAVVEFSAEGRAMGEDFTVGTGIRIAARISDPDPGDQVSMIELFRGMTGLSSAVRVAFNENNAEFWWRELDTFPAMTEAHYYLRIKMASGFSIWTGPVYVTYDPSLPTAVLDPIPSRLSLAAPSPNPARGWASISFTLPQAANNARLRIFDLSGRLVRSLVDGFLAPGTQSIRWDGVDDNGREIRPGVYFIQLQTEHGSVSRKLLFLR